MGEHIWWVFGIALTIILGLIAVIYNALVGRIDRLVKSTEVGLDLKVDESSYKIAHQYERDLFDDMKVCIKELKDENSVEHKAIMIEIRRQHE